METSNYNSRNTFLSGESVILSILTREDVTQSNWYGWFNDESTTKHLQKHYYPNTLESQLKFVEEAESDKSKIQLGIRRKSNPTVLLGVISLQHINLINRNAELSIVIGENEARGLEIA